MSIYAKRKKCHIVGNGTGKKSFQQAGRPPDRPWPGSRPAVSGGWPAPRPALAGLQAGSVWWVAGLGRAPGRAPLVGGRPPGRLLAGFQAGGLGWVAGSPACSCLPIDGRPPGRPGPISRPEASGWWPAPRPAQAGLQAGDPVCSCVLLFQTASFCGGVLIPLHLPRDNYHDQKKNTTIVRKLQINRSPSLATQSLSSLEI